MNALLRFSIWVKQPYHLAKGVLANLVYGFPSRGLKIIAVTGTDGKTTTSTMIYNILLKAGKKVALISTVAAYIGSKEIDTGFHVTSPEEFALQKLLLSIKKDGFEYVVLEATSHGIVQHRLFGIHPDVAVLTNITHEHLDYHGTYNEYLKAKSRLLLRSKLSILNGEDSSFKPVREILRKKHKKFVEYNKHAQDPALDRAIQNRFVEGYNRANAIAASTAAQILNISTAVCIEGLKAFPGVKGRMEEIPNSKKIRVIVDFAHTPNALENALKALRSSMKKGQRLIAVYGSAGLRDNTKRPMMGAAGADFADETIFTSEDPRTEDVWVIMRQMKEGVKRNHGHVFQIADRREAIAFAIHKLAKPGDTVGIFGKGHERSMNLDGKREIPWSDQEVVQEILSAS